VSKTGVRIEKSGIASAAAEQALQH
jgi:hypothetical protein